MNKLGFIRNLLEVEKFTTSQKERFLKLVAQELSNIELGDAKILAEIDAIKEKIGLSDKPKFVDNKSEDQLSEDEIFVKKIVCVFNPVYFKPDIKNSDPRNTSLKERMEVLSNVTDDNLSEKVSFLKRIKEKHKNLESKEGLNAINRGFFLIKQKEVYNGEYEHIGISRDTFIIPSYVAHEIVLMGKGNSGFDSPIEGTKKEVNNDKVVETKKLHKPLETKNFLSLFNNSDHLKFLTHRFNSNKRDYDEFIELCKNEFEYYKEEYKNVPDALLRRVEEFAFKEKPEWFVRKGNDRIYPKKGWSEKQFIEWYKKDINIHPSSDSKWNNQMIKPFKETIEVRAGNLPNIINEAINFGLGESKNNFLINPEDLSNSSLKEAEFYTDVDMFQNALNVIFSTIRENAERNLCFKIDVSFSNETINGGEFKKLMITHIGSKTNKNSNDPAFAKGDLKSIQRNLWGLCNYEIIGEFPDGYKKRIFLTDRVDEYKNYVEPQRSMDVDKSEIDGFSHILKFY